MTAINRWVLSCQNRVANVWYNQDYTVFGLNPTPGGQPADNSNIVTLHDLGNGTVALQCGAPAFASVRDDYGMQVQFQAPYGGGNWITSVGGDEILQVIPTGDGYFALRSATFGGFVAINPNPDGKAGNCNALVASAPTIGQAARFTATGLDRNSIFDFLKVGSNASGMSFAGLNLASVDLSGKNNLSGCDFRDVASLSGCNLEGATLQRAQFAGLRLGGLNLSGADCTEADFTRSDFTSFTPGMPPPFLNGAMLAGAVVPAGISWAGAKMAGAVLAEANLTGCDLSGPPVGLTDAHVSRQGVTLLDNAGIGGDDLASPADRVVAYDYDGSGKLDHLVCYRPGTGAIFIVKKNADGTFAAVYSQGDPGGAGIGGYNLASPADQVFAYDYDGTGKLDHLVCYRPGTGLVRIMQKRTAGAATLAQCDLRQANLTDANLVGLDLTTTASLAGANLSGTQLPGTKLAGANLTGVILVGTDFTGTDLTKVRFSFPLNQSTDPDNPTIFAGCTLPYAVIGLNWSCLDLTTTTITGLPTNPAGAVNLTGLVAQGMRRPNGHFDGFILDGANFAHATLDGAHFTGASLRAKRGILVNFSGARLINAYFTQAALEQADFSGAVLGGLQKEESAHFSYAFLSNCKFDQANLFGVHFPGATLLENLFTNVADIQQADFTNAYLPSGDFTSATLRGATFDDAFMVECILSSADLTPAEGALATSLTGAFLQGVTWQHQAWRRRPHEGGHHQGPGHD